MKIIIRQSRRIGRYIDLPLVRSGYCPLGGYLVPLTWCDSYPTSEGSLRISNAMTTAIRLENLSKTYGKGEGAVPALVDVNLEIQPGQIYGFLGPNGAGKTTTIRLLAGMIHPSGGSAQIFGKDVHQHPDVLARVGVLIEEATFYGFMTGWENLEALARTSGALNRPRIEELVEQLGMRDHVSRKVGTYSTGMKQRLGVVSALMGDPDLAVFDEPTNGLDPIGRQEMRTFIRELAHQNGLTVFLSSHLLHEVEQVCDRVAIIHRGRIVREGPVAELLCGEHAQLRLQVSPLDKAMQALKGHWDSAQDGEWILVSANHEESHKVVEFLVKRSVRVQQVVQQKRTLEELFMDAVTGGGEDQSGGDVKGSGSNA
jgi:ABC-2 type transport system ATP-binding protein